MEIPAESCPMGLDVYPQWMLDMPHKEHVIAYYKSGKFGMIYGKSYDNLIANSTIIVQSIKSGNAYIAFGNKTNKGISVNAANNGYQFFNVTDRYYQRNPAIDNQNAIFGGGYGYCFGYVPKNYNLSGGTTNIRDNNYTQSATNINFSCCFDSKISKAEFDEIAEWILNKL